MTLYNSEYCHDDPFGDELDVLDQETFDPEGWEDMMTRRNQDVRTQ